MLLESFFYPVTPINLNLYHKSIRKTYFRPIELSNSCSCCFYCLKLVYITMQQAHYKHSLTTQLLELLCIKLENIKNSFTASTLIKLVCGLNEIP